MKKSYKELMNDITTFIFDVDGVLTDSSVHVTENGEMLRIMNIRDGFAMKAAIESGYNVCIISGGNNDGVRILHGVLGILRTYSCTTYLSSSRVYVWYYGSMCIHAHDTT